MALASCLHDGSTDRWNCAYFRLWYLFKQPWMYVFMVHFFHFPASSTPFATLLAPSSTPLPIRPKPSPTGLPALPVALLMVSPIPRPAAPVTLPRVRVTPPTVLPTVEVTHLAALVAPWSWLLVIGMVCRVWFWPWVVCGVFCFGEDCLVGSVEYRDDGLWVHSRNIA